MVKYYGLRFRETTPGYAESYWKKEAERIAAEQRGEPWKVGNEFTYLGFDTYEYTYADGDFEERAIMWFRKNEGGPNGYLETYFDKDDNEVQKPIKEEKDEDLYYKYDMFLYGLRGLRRAIDMKRLDILEIEKNYDLEIHIKPDVVKEEILIEPHYQNKNSSFFIANSDYSYKKNLKKDILSCVDSNLSTKEQLLLRGCRAKTALKDLYSTLKNELTEQKQKILANYMKNKNNNNEIPSVIIPQVLFYNKVKESLSEIFSYERNLVYTGKSDIQKFDRTINSLLECAKNKEKRNVYSERLTKVMGENYKVKPKKTKRPTDEEVNIR